MGQRILRELTLILDPPFSHQHLDVQLAVFALVPHLPCPHALEIDVVLLLVEIDRKQLG